MGNVIRIRSRCARVPFAFRNPKTSGGRSRGVKGEREVKRKRSSSSTARERGRNRRDVISIDDDGSGDGDGDDGEIEERKG